MTKRKQQKGFTLVELSIVLVIIGLIIGGVLVGQDLIKAAEIRSTIQFLEQTNAATNTFRGKFNGLPGDILYSKADQFNFTPNSAARLAGGGGGAAGSGDADGLIENGNDTGATDTASLIDEGLGHETLMFWSDLTQAALIPATVTPATSVAPVAYATPALLMAAAVLPQTNLRELTFIHVYSLNGRNFYYMGQGSVAANGTLTPVNGLTPKEALAIDEKLDDGDGDQGTVLAINDLDNTEVIAADAAGAANDCWDDTNGVYNADDTFGEIVACRISVRTSF